MIDWNRRYVYDTESYPNAWTCGVVHCGSGTRWIFEASDRMNTLPQFCELMRGISESGSKMIGFNNEHYDYPMIHPIIACDGNIDAARIYEKNQAIFSAGFNDWSHNIWARDRFVPQIDLFKIMHFDNLARSTSLKKLEIAMRMFSVQDLPFPPGTMLTPEMIDITIGYMCHDINATFQFAMEIADQIDFRDTLTEKYGRDYTNFNDTKIGKQHFIDQLESAGVACYEKIDGKRTARQTPRYEGIVVADKLLSVPFTTPDLQRMHKFFSETVIPAHMTKGFFKDLSANLGQFQIDFGAGGVHGSVNRRAFVSNDTHAIFDIDVVSFYPSLAIVYGWYPQHLGPTFCTIYEDLKRQRVSYKKGTPENAMLKLALNGVYGDSNNMHSPFYDPAYTMAITINGQMLLSWLAEMVMLNVPGAEMIQMNTDGLTVWMPRTSIPHMRHAMKHWEGATGLDLEHVEYKQMHVRDVNNYRAEDMNGKVKYKNAYLLKPDWHQDRSSLVIPQAVDAYIRDGTTPTDYIFAHTDPFDFMRHIKVPRNSTLRHGDTLVQNTSRYYISLTGKPLTKTMPPLAGKTDDRLFSVEKGWNVDMCNLASDFDWNKLNRRYYINEAEKLIDGLGLSVTATTVQDN